jgi:hypothetical protein
MELCRNYIQSKLLDLCEKKEVRVQFTDFDFGFASRYLLLG